MRLTFSIVALFILAWFDPASAIVLGMAVTANQLIERQEKNRTGYKVAASTTIYQGTLTFINASGYLDDDTGNGGNTFAGIATEYCDNVFSQPVRSVLSRRMIRVLTSDRRPRHGPR